MTNEVDNSTGSEHQGAVMGALKVFLFSVIRTVIPVAVGWVLSLLVLAGLPADSLSTAVEGLVTAVLTAAYYIVVRLLELYVAPWLGWLLGVPARPAAYVK